ncbi:TMEM43 family protein [Leptospira wolffii]|uniref:TMEM43 family protein n=1 Tax=Leptospira wolffii TaxID=409998 RepID=A0ABV5BSH3_9LEPT
MAFESSDGMSSSESVGIFGQLGDSITGVLIGVVLFPASLYIIFKVETCTQASAAFKNAVPAAQAQAGVPSYVTGSLSADPLGGEFVKAGKYISYSQSSEVLAWEEEVKEEGSGTDKKKVRECKLDWTSSPKNPSGFQLSGCKSKPYHRRTVSDESLVASDGKLKSGDGKVYSVNLKQVEFASAVPSGSPEESALSRGILSDDYVYLSEKCAKDQTEGCERIQVTVTPIPAEEMTFIGSVKGNSIAQYILDDDAFLNASLGDFQSTMKDIQSDDNIKKWIGRGIGFVAMWVSFNMLVGPILALLSFIPFVGGLGKTALSFVLGVVAFIITATTILLVKFWYIWLIIGLAAIGYAIYKKKAATA